MGRDRVEIKVLKDAARTLVSQVDSDHACSSRGVANGGRHLGRALRESAPIHGHDGFGDQLTALDEFTGERIPSRASSFT